MNELAYCFKSSPLKCNCYQLISYFEWGKGFEREGPDSKNISGEKKAEGSQKTSHTSPVFSGPELFAFIHTQKRGHEQRYFLAYTHLLT